MVTTHQGVTSASSFNLSFFTRGDYVFISLTNKAGTRSLLCKASSARVKPVRATAVAISSGLLYFTAMAKYVHAYSAFFSKL